LVVGLWKQRRFAIVLVTHDVEEAILLADRIAVLDGGAVADLLDVDLPRPRSRRDDRFESLRVRILEDLGVSDVDARLSAHAD
ncbi:MAG: sulfonate ABC transporter ATP-binding protein, partial [Solirubrobacteraceae bacterium]